MFNETQHLSVRWESLTLSWDSQKSSMSRKMAYDEHKVERCSWSKCLNTHTSLSPHSRSLITVSCGKKTPSMPDKNPASSWCLLLNRTVFIGQRESLTGKMMCSGTTAGCYQNTRITQEQVTKCFTLLYAFLDNMTTPRRLFKCSLSKGNSVLPKNKYFCGNEWQIGQKDPSLLPLFSVKHTVSLFKTTLLYVQRPFAFLHRQKAAHLSAATSGPLHLSKHRHFSWDTNVTRDQSIDLYWNTTYLGDMLISFWTWIDHIPSSPSKRMLPGC